MDLFLANPLWIVLALLTVAVHVGFFLAIRRLIKADSRANAKTPGNDETERSED